MCITDRARGIRDQCQRTSWSDAMTHQFGLGQEAFGVESRDPFHRGKRLSRSDPEFGQPRNSRIVEGGIGTRRRFERLGRVRGGGEFRQKALYRKLVFWE
jgi:hypothetical protein